MASLTDLGNACSAFSDLEIEELKSIAKIYDEASGALIKFLGWIGNKAENLINKMPHDWHEYVSGFADVALRVSYAAAEVTHSDPESSSFINDILKRAEGEGWHKVASAVTGAVGGLGGIVTVATDLAVTTTLAMRTIQQVAASYGEDISDEEVRLSCLSVFGLGGPLIEDDDVETGLYTTRMSLNGRTLASVLEKVLPRFIPVISEKIIAQSVPILGAVAGSVINPTFIGYYQKMAHVHFRLRRLEERHDQDEIRACFERIMKARRKKSKRR